MPIVLDGGTFDVVLPGATPLTFTCKYLTCRQLLKYEKLLKDANAERGQSKSNDLLTQALALSVTGWSGVATEFSPDAVDDVLTVMEKWELVYRVLADMQATEMDKKKSQSMSQGSGVNSAPDAPGESAKTPTSSASTS